jgi:pyruvate dehydrogenase E1 component
LLGSGAILREVIEGSRLLEAKWGVSSEVWSVTNYSVLARDARAADRHNRLNPSDAPIQCRLVASLPGEAPIIAASDYVCAYPQLITAYVEGPLALLERMALALATRAPLCAPSSRSTAIML